MGISTRAHREERVFPLGNRLMAPRLNGHGGGQQVPPEGALESQMRRTGAANTVLAALRKCLLPLLAGKSI